MHLRLVGFLAGAFVGFIGFIGFIGFLPVAKPLCGQHASVLILFFLCLQVCEKVYELCARLVILYPNTDIVKHPQYH